MDTDGYPDDNELEIIKNWNPMDMTGLLDYIEPMWKYADCGYWGEEDGWYHISTAGWSGNESIIGAMMENIIWWTMYWYSSTCGGHYVFATSQKRIERLSRADD